MKLYVIDEYYNPIVEEDTKKWGEFWVENDYRRNFLYTEIGGFKVYTSFLTIDHSFGNSPTPLLFETMILSDHEGWLDYQTRCYGPEEAKQMHAAAIKTLHIEGIEL